MTKLIIGGALIIIGAVLAVWGYNAHKPATDVGVICTADAMLCPDGSYVSRHGPNCEFNACPVATSTGSGGNTGGGGGILPYNSGVRGSVQLGPTCPVERIPPEPQCAPKPYSTLISIYRKGSSYVFINTKSDANGHFEASMPPGEYTVAADGGNTLPRCSPVSLVVEPNLYASTTIYCDTGIR